jgi:hypothetical protein
MHGSFGGSLLSNSNEWTKYPSVTARQVKWVKRLGLALLCYTVIGFLVLPAIIKWQLVKRLPSMTHRAVRVDAVRVNPYALSLTVRGLALTEPDGQKFASWSNFHVNFEAFGSLAHWSWTFKRIELDEPYGYVALLTNGQFNFASLLTNAPASAKTNATPKPPPRLRVHSLIISNGALEFADFNRVVPFRTKFTPIDLRLTKFTTQPATDTPYSFIASTGEGESFAWRGDFSVVPLTSLGRFELSGIDLKKYGPYVSDFVQFELHDGKVSIAASYQTAVSPNVVDLVVTNGSVMVTNLQVRAPGTSNNIVAVPSFAVHGAEANLAKRTARVASIETGNGAIVARRFHSGELEFVALAKPATNMARLTAAPPASTTAASTNMVAPAAPWSVVLQRFSVSNYTVKVEDAQPATPASLLADQISLTLTNISTASNTPVGLRLFARLNEGGTVTLHASAVVLPSLRAELDVDVSGIDLPALQSYVSEQAKLTIQSGRVTTRGRASVAIEGTNAPKLDFAGNVSVNDFASIDQMLSQDFAKWKEIALEGIDLSLHPLVLKVERLSCDGLSTSVVLDTNRQPTFVTMLPPKANATNVATASASASPGPPTHAAPLNVQLGLLFITNASLRLADFSVQPPCKFVVQNFSGTVTGLSPASDAAADVDISGRIDENAPFVIRGKVNPLASDMLVDLVISNRTTDLTAFTPYMEKFAGYPLQKGKLSVALRYDVKQRALKAENVVSIDQLTLGQKNDSPDATKLPVKLGIALLKDRNGKIELNVPVNGRLDDPKFKVGPVIWQVVMNMLAKAATSPFALLGAVVGGGEELSFVEFAPGRSAIPDNESSKIEKLSRALYERPALNLEITGSTDDSLDRAALAWLKLERELKSLRTAELAGKSGAPASADAIRFEPREYVRALRTYYKQTFNRSRPLSADASGGTNSAGGGRTNLVANPATRSEARKGAEILVARDALKPAPQATNTAPAALSPAAATRPASLPALDPKDEVLAQMESELFARAKIGEAELHELAEQRAKSVQRALLQTEKMEGERLFLLAPKTSDGASNGQSRVNLSLN